LLNFIQNGIGPTCLKITGHGTLGFNNADKSGGLKEFLDSHADSDFGVNNKTKTLLVGMAKIKATYPSVSYPDLFSFCSAVTISNSCGPEIIWRPGRPDIARRISGDDKKVRRDDSKGKLSISSARPGGNGNFSDVNPPVDKSRGSRDLFAKLNLENKCIVALMGVHGMGRSRPENSGFVNRPRTYSELKFSNALFRTLSLTRWYPGNFTYKGNKLSQYFNKNKTLAVTDAEMSIAPINDTSLPKGQLSILC
jgi:catalase (peroxidase I)